jgi:hypothetical protein
VKIFRGILVTLGGAETPEFHWQTNQFIEKWKLHDALLGYHTELDVGHFSVVERLASKDSQIFKKISDWLL